MIRWERLGKLPNPMGIRLNDQFMFEPKGEMHYLEP